MSEKAKEKFWYMRPKDQEHFCKVVNDYMKEEATAIAEYNALAAEARELFEVRKDPAGNILGILFEKLASDEASHADALKKIARNVCPI